MRCGKLTEGRTCRPTPQVFRRIFHSVSQPALLSLRRLSAKHGEGEVLIVLYINVDTHEAYTEAEVRQAYDDNMAQLAADGIAARAPTYEQWLEEQCDLGLLVVDIDD